MEANRAKLTKIRATLDLMERQALKEHVDVARLKTKLGANELDLELISVAVSEAEQNETTRQMSNDLSEAFALVEDIYAHCARKEREERLALEKVKSERSEKAELQALEFEKLKLEKYEKTEAAKIAAQIESERIKAERLQELELERVKIEADRIQAEQRAEVEQARLTHELEMKKLDIQAAQGLPEEAQVARTQKPTGYGSVLPKLNIPTFSGDPIAWLNFSDLFSALVGNNAALNSSQKLQYLKNALRDQAALLIANLPSTDANFELAWKLLSDRYSSPRDLVAAYVRRLLELPIQKIETADGLRKLADSTREIMRSLDILQRTPKLGEDIIVYSLSQRISHETRKDWMVTQKTKDPPNLDNLLEFLDRRAEALHTTDTKSTDFKLSSSTGFKHGKGNQQSGKKRISAASVEQKGQKCAHCDANNHLIFQCRTFSSLSPQERKQWVIQHQRCFQCLAATHMISHCNSKRLCNVCHGKHNTLLHLDTRSADVNGQRSTGAAMPAAQISTVPAVSNLNPMSDSFSPQYSVCSTSFTTSPKTPTETLLFTAQVLVKARNGSFHLCRVLIDPGSMTSLVSEATARQLWLPRKKSQVDILGINSKLPARNLGEVQLVIKSRVDEKFLMNTTAIVLPRLTSNLHYTRLMEWGGLTFVVFS